MRKHSKCPSRTSAGQSLKSFHFHSLRTRYTILPDGCIYYTNSVNCLSKELHKLANPRARFYLKTIRKSCQWFLVNFYSFLKFISIYKESFELLCCIRQLGTVSSYCHVVVVNLPN